MRLWLAAVLALLVLAGSAAAGTVPAPWQAAADRLDMPVLHPTYTPNLNLRRVVPVEIECGNILEELDGYYTGPNGRKLRVAEGKPYYCGDIGDAKLLARPTIRGKRASVYDYCEGTGCRNATYRFLLTWREQGIQIVLISRGTPRPTLYAIARSMERVEDSTGGGDSGGLPYRVPGASRR
jgi:hypothetical protein